MFESSPDFTEIRSTDCPLFINPEEYLLFRRGKYLFGFFKRWSERRAIDKSLKDLADIYSVCDTPCGPGRLFEYWSMKKYRVFGVDLSAPMVDAAREMCKAIDRRNRALKGNAFALKDVLEPGAVDLVASVRFYYYFKRDERIQLLKSMAEVSRKYLLLQYKTTETRKGRREMRKIASMPPAATKQYCSNEEIRDELKSAGLDCIRIVPISQASDRIFVVAGKQDI